MTTNMEKAIFKFNSGKGALLCSGCHVILKESKDMTENEKKAMRGECKLAPQYCDDCKVDKNH